MLAANFLQLLVKNRRLFALRDIITGFRKLSADHRDEVTADVTSAVALSGTQADELKATLKAKTGKSITLIEKSRSRHSRRPGRQDRQPHGRSLDPYKIEQSQICHERGRLMEIRASEISSILKEQIKNFGQEAEVSEIGQVLSIGDGIARVYGLDNVRPARWSNSRAAFRAWR